MAAPKGNDYYKLRSKDGRDKIFKTPKALLDACNSYFQWCLENPLKEQVAFHNRGVISYGNVNKMRPFTLEGLCNFIDIAKSTFQEYEKNQDFSAITTRIRQIIENQQFEGAAAGFLNPNIIARKLGLHDSADITSKGEKLETIRIFELPSNGR